MDYEYIPPPLPRFARWRALYRRFPGQSVLRALEYEKLSSLEFRGRVLDVGGGKHARYVGHINGASEIESVNIDPDIEPTYLIRPDEPFPIGDDRYDGVVCFNTLEHVYDAMFVLSEIHRVLKPGATAHIAIPFIFRIHAHPDDYFRATPSWWQRSVERAGFSAMTLSPLTWGRRTTAAMISGSPILMPKKWQSHLAHLMDILYAAVTLPRGDTYAGPRGERICAVAAGWYISATK